MFKSNVGQHGKLEGDIEKGDQEKASTSTRLVAPRMQEDGHTRSWDCEDRDFYSFGPDVKVTFEDSFTEPDDLKDTACGRIVGGKVVHGCYSYLYLYCRSGIFYLFSIVIGWLVALCCGFFFGLTSVFQVWMAQPMLRMAFTWLRLISTANRVIVRACCDPCCQSIGQSLSYIRGRFKADVNGVTFTNQTQTYNYGAVDDEDKDKEKE